jgi:lipopolysaccharide assembly protein A
MMRYLYLALILGVTLVVVTFKVQNIESVTVNFATASLTLPLSVLIFGVYFLGMVTGSALLALVRTWYQGAKEAMPSRK